jgi:anti-sigma B factor antagonist
MPLTIDTRRVGRVTVVHCSGRIVAGTEADSLNKYISALLPEEADFVLHLGEVTFVDSSGLGAMVRALSSSRRYGGDIKLCNVTREVESILKLTNLTQLFQIHAAEEEAITAFYCQSEAPKQPARTGVRVLCIDHSSDVLAYVRALLTRAGLDVLTSANLPDALILLRATGPKLVVLGPNLRASTGTMEAFEKACCVVPVVELGREFATLDAGEAAAHLLEDIQARLGLQSRATEAT